MRDFSQKGRSTLTEPSEECVLYVYDDKVPKRHLPDGRFAYPEWDGGPVKGTLTIGIGHTDAAGAPKIFQGMRITRAQADEIFANDLAPCVRAVNRALHVEVTQHQFDAVCDVEFNCPSALPALAKLINAGNLEAVPAKLMQYTFSKGEHMQGLVNRRAAEIRWWNTPDDPGRALVEHNFSPKAERNPPPSTMRSSTTGNAALTMGAGGLVAAAQAANEALEPIKQARGSLPELGVFDHLAVFAHQPLFLVGAIIVALAAYVWWERRQKLVNDHV
jgi:lysozyme